MDYQQKYLKYKKKYTELQSFLRQTGGVDGDDSKQGVPPSGMAVAPTAINKIKSLENIIGKLELDHSDTPDEIYEDEKLVVEKALNEFIIWNPTTRDRVEINLSEAHVEESKVGKMKRVSVFYKKYKCSLSGAFIAKEDLFTVNLKLIVNEYKISPEKKSAIDDTHEFLKTIPRVPVIDMPPTNIWGPYNEICFVFNIEDTRKSTLMALLMGVNSTGIPILA